MRSLRAHVLTPVVCFTAILALGGVFALAGVYEWNAPAPRPVTGKAAPLYFIFEALWGLKGPAYAYWGISSLCAVFALAGFTVLARQEAKLKKIANLHRT